jgi:hypothetical protein
MVLTSRAPPEEEAEAAVRGQHRPRTAGSSSSSRPGGRRAGVGGPRRRRLKVVSKERQHARTRQRFDRAERQRRRVAVARISFHWRCYSRGLARRRAAAALVVQRRIRGGQGRRDLMRLLACRTVQHYARGFLQRLAKSKAELLSAAVIHIQRSVRLPASQGCTACPSSPPRVLTVAVCCCGGYPCARRPQAVPVSAAAPLPAAAGGGAGGRRRRAAPRGAHALRGMAGAQPAVRARPAPAAPVRHPPVLVAARPHGMQTAR